MRDINLTNFNFSHILVDPPRSGLSKNVIKIINKFDNIIYISCSPESYIRDIKYLKDYEITNIELFDQFPNSKHLEIVSLLSKK
jgi:tRNA (uracil-5-)-methyltransferase